jgi:hypothetical protein
MKLSRWRTCNFAAGPPSLLPPLVLPNKCTEDLTISAGWDDDLFNPGMVIVFW